MDANTIRVYEILKAHWGEKEATDVLDYLDNEATLKVKRAVKRAVENKIGNLANREDILELKKDILATKEDVLAIKEDVLKLETTIANNYANIIKWMFVFWIGTMGTVIAIMKLL